MSTAYRFSESVTKESFLKVLKEINVEEHVCDGTNENQFCISDGKNFMWCYCGTDSKINDFCRYGVNYSAEHFLEYAASELKVYLLSEHDDNFFENKD